MSEGTAVTVISVLHNLSRDAGSGLNVVLDDNGEVTEARSHPLVKVFEFEAGEWHVPEAVYRALNVGHKPGYGQPGSPERTLAMSYRARRLRSLSIGDVLVIGGQYLAVERMGFAEVQERDLRIVDATAAEVIVRKKFRLRPGEQLTVSVPWTGATGEED